MTATTLRILAVISLTAAYDGWESGPLCRPRTLRVLGGRWSTWKLAGVAEQTAAEIEAVTGVTNRMSIACQPGDGPQTLAG